MLNRYHQIIVTLIGIGDLVLAYSCWELAYGLRFWWINYPPAEHIPLLERYTVAGGILVLLTGITFLITGVYRDHRWNALTEAFRLLQACVILFILVQAIAFFYRGFSYSRVQMVYFMAVFMLGLLVFRWSVRRSLKILYRRGWHLENAILVGNSAVAKPFIDAFKRHRYSGISLQGIVTTDESVKGNAFHIPQLGMLKHLRCVIEVHQIRQVFIILAAEQHSYLAEIRELLSDQLVDIKIIPDLGNFQRLRINVETLQDIPIITVTQSPLVGWNIVWKRLLDVIGSIVSLLIFGPVMLLIGALMKFTSPGPVFYRQERMGFDGITFKAWKFRSMRVDAEAGTGAVWAKANDDRVTPLGRFLRKTSLDELPQLFNVLQGNMSLVGPRPERPVLIEAFKHQIPGYMLRHKIKAGMTGLAQIRGWRGNTSLEKRIECDLYYIEHWSLWLDIKILFMTIFKGFMDKNAY